MATRPEADPGTKTEGRRHDAAPSSLRDWSECDKSTHPDKRSLPYLTNPDISISR